VNAWKEALGVEVKEHDGELRLAHLRTIFARWANNPPLARKHAASIARDNHAERGERRATTGDRQHDCDRRRGAR
jgi:hypothetical protein